MNVFEEMRNGKAYYISDPKYVADVLPEFNRCWRLCQVINATDVRDQAKIKELESELFQDKLADDTYLMPPFQIDAGCRVKLGKNVFANHDLNIMSLGTVTIEDGVMLGPEVAILTVNHEPKDIRLLHTKEIRIKKNAWIGARVSILPGVTIGENAIVGTGSIVTKDIPDNCVAVGSPARVIKTID